MGHSEGKELGHRAGLERGRKKAAGLEMIRGQMG
jgi:hypothetical protein